MATNLQRLISVTQCWVRFIPQHETFCDLEVIQEDDADYKRKSSSNENPKFIDESKSSQTKTNIENIIYCKIVFAYLL